MINKKPYFPQDKKYVVLGLTLEMTILTTLVLVILGVF